MTKEEWARKKAYYEDKVKELTIPVDAGPAAIKRLLAKIDALFTEARLDLVRTEVADDDIDRKIYVTEKEYAEGKNDIERRRNGITAVKVFPLANGTTIDLWEIQKATNERYKFMDSIIDILNQKQSRLITANGIMKIESQLSPHGDAGWNAGN